MKGIVFTEFLDMVEKEYGYETVDQIIEQSSLPSEGIYTAVGTYSHGEMIQLLSNLSNKVGLETGKLLKFFGRYIFDTFLQSYPQFFANLDNSFDFLESIDKHIHVEVLKLYPDASLPKFISYREQDGRMVMIYKSDRRMADFAEGLIEKSIEHFKEECSIKSEAIEADGSAVRFTIVRR